jgi:hypothetical protein
MIGRHRPLILGYLRKHLLITEHELADVQERFAHFARREGFDLVAVYVEEIETAPAAFEDLVQAVYQLRPGAIVLPSLFHLAGLGAPHTIKGHFEHLTGARVLVATTITSRLAGVLEP